MVGRKKIRTRGKFQLSKYFQELKEGDNVSLVVEKSVASSFPKRMQGRTGVVESRRGRSWIVRIKDQNQEKRYIVEPIHLKKIIASK